MKTVCFLGDSITRRGYWIAEIFEHLRTRGIVAYNCGVSGDSASGAFARCLPRRDAASSSARRHPTTMSSPPS